MRRLFTLAAVLVGLIHTRGFAVPARPASPDGSSGQGPNVVLILSDYMGYGDIGPYGATDIRTPNLDRLARAGVRLVNAYGAAPICTPSRAGLLTGRYPQRAGFEVNVNPEKPEIGLSPSETTIARMLQDAGYATALIGKWHLGYDPRFMPAAHGFERFFGHLEWTIDYYSHRTIDGAPGLYQDAAPVEKEGYITDLFTEQAISFIRYRTQRPFFLYLAYNAALAPCQPPNRPDDIRTAKTWNSSTRTDYIKVVEALDAGIGRVLAELERLKLAENTLVIYTYDHGGGHLSRKEPLFHGFGTLWEGGIRVPCILRWPGRLPAGKTSRQIAINMDLAATILAAAGVAPRPGRDLDGINLVPLLQSRAAEEERTLFWRVDYPLRKQKAVRQGRWKYMRDASTDMLFDVEADLGERHDLIYQNHEVVARLRQLLAQWETSIRN